MDEALVVSQPVGELVTAPSTAAALVGTPAASQLVITDPSGATQVLVASAPTPGEISVQPVVSMALVGSAPSAQLLVGVEALAILEAIGSDNIISAAEKKTLVPLMSQVITEAAGYVASADAIGIDSSAYVDAVNALAGYLATLTTPVAWNDTSGITNVNGATLRTFADAVYTARTSLQAALQTITYRQAAEPTGGTYSLADRWLQEGAGIPVPILYGWSGTAWQRMGAAGDLATQNTLLASYSNLAAGGNLLQDDEWCDTNLDGTEPHFWEVTPPAGITITIEDDGLGAAYIGAPRSLKIPVDDPGTGAGGQATVSASHRLPLAPGEAYRLVFGVMGTGPGDTTTYIGRGCAADVQLTITGHDYLTGSTGVLFSKDLTVDGNSHTGFDLKNPFFSAIFSAADATDADVDIVVSYGGTAHGQSAGFLRLGKPRVFRLSSDGQLLHARGFAPTVGTDITGVMTPTVQMRAGDIAYLGDTGVYQGQQRLLRLVAGSTLKTSAYLILPGGTDIACATDDVAWVYAEPGDYDPVSGNAIWRLRAYFRANGKALTPPTLAEIEGAVSPVTHDTAAAGQTTFTLNRAMNPGDEPKVLLWVGGSMQDSSQYTFNGTTTATLGFAMAAGDAWRAINFG